MKTIKEIQDFIFEKVGLKTGVRQGKGSMKDYLIVYPIFQNGCYPNIPHEVVTELKSILPDHDFYSTFCTVSDISIHSFHGFTNERNTYKSEKKPKEISEMKVKTWGSANSQMRLDKTAARYAKKRRGSNGDSMVKYW